MFKKIVLVTLMGATLAACESTGTKQTIGALAGAAGGAALGSRFGGGSGQVAAIAAGTLLGAFLGSEVGKSLDSADKAAMASTTNQALETQPTNSVAAWQNPDSGNSGTITPTKTYQTSGGTYCREFQQTITVGGKTEQGFGTACRQPDGSWKIVN